MSVIRFGCLLVERGNFGVGGKPPHSIGQQCACFYVDLSSTTDGAQFANPLSRAGRVARFYRLDNHRKGKHNVNRRMDRSGPHLRLHR